MKDESKICIHASKELIPVFDDFYHKNENKGIWKHEGHRYVCTKFTILPPTEMDRYCDAERMDKCVFYETMR